jgi:hypothetical protein
VLLVNDTSIENPPGCCAAIWREPANLLESRARLPLDLRKLVGKRGEKRFIWHSNDQLLAPT